MLLLSSLLLPSLSLLPSLLLLPFSCSFLLLLFLPSFFLLLPDLLPSPLVLPLPFLPFHSSSYPPSSSSSISLFPHYQPTVGLSSTPVPSHLHPLSTLADTSLFLSVHTPSVLSVPHIPARTREAALPLSLCPFPGVFPVTPTPCSPHSITVTSLLTSYFLHLVLSVPCDP